MWGQGRPKGAVATVPEELVGEVTEKATSMTINEVGRQGVRFAQNAQGRTKGLYDAAHMCTVEGLLQPDGTSEIEFRGMEMTTEGDAILLQGRGTMRLTSPTTKRGEGSATYQTASKMFAWLNSAKIRWEGTSDTATGEAKTRFFAQR